MLPRKSSKIIEITADLAVESVLLHVHRSKLVD